MAFAPVAGFRADGTGAVVLGGGARVCKEPILHDAAYHPNVCYTQYHLPSWIGGHVPVNPKAIASNHRLR
jgi:hypothetical protein